MYLDIPGLLLLVTNTRNWDNIIGHNYHGHYFQFHAEDLSVNNYNRENLNNVCGIKVRE